MTEKTSDLLEKGTIFKGLIFLAWPVLALNVMQNMVSLADIFFVGKVGVSALSAIAISSIVFSIFWSMQGGFMGGSIAMISRYAGSRNYEKMSRTLFNMTIVTFLNAVVYVTIMLLFLENILSFFGAQGETLKFAKEFTVIMLLAFLFASILFTFVASFRGAGDNMAPLYLAGTALLINFILDPVFIFGLLGMPAMGIKGAAVAYFISIIIPCAYALYRFFSGKGAVRFDPGGLKPDLSICRKYLLISVPAMAQGLIANLTVLTMLRIASGYGDEFIAAFGIGGRLDVFVMFFAWSIGSSVSIMVGHNMGAGRHERPAASIKTGIKMISYVTVSAFILFFIFSERIIGIFNADERVVSYGSEYLRHVTPAYILMGIGIITAMGFNGAGRTKIGMYINLGAFFALQIPLAVFLTGIPEIAER
ncbi:MAG: MATE family efflux transporter, partial [bacterium]